MNFKKIVYSPASEISLKTLLQNETQLAVNERLNVMSCFNPV